jgi:hypothetical protein
MFGKNESPRGKRRAQHLERAWPAMADGPEEQDLSVSAQWSARRGRVGLDDEWSGHIDPALAWHGVDPELPITH